MLLWSGLLALLGKPTALSNLLSSSSCVPRCLEWQLIGGWVGFAISTPTTTTASLGLACVSWEPVTVLAADKTSPRLLQWRVLVKDSLHLAVEQFDVAVDWCGSRTELTVGYRCVSVFNRLDIYSDRRRLLPFSLLAKPVDSIIRKRSNSMCHFHCLADST